MADLSHAFVIAEVLHRMGHRQQRKGCLSQWNGAIMKVDAVERSNLTVTTRIFPMHHHEEQESVST
jgi:hypothetical protein